MVACGTVFSFLGTVMLIPSGKADSIPVLDSSSAYVCSVGDHSGEHVAARALARMSESLCCWMLDTAFVASTLAAMVGGKLVRLLAWGTKVSGKLALVPPDTRCWVGGSESVAVASALD